MYDLCLCIRMYICVLESLYWKVHMCVLRMCTCICLYACMYVSKIINVINVSIPGLHHHIPLDPCRIQSCWFKVLFHEGQRERSVKPSCYLNVPLPARPCSRSNAFTSSGRVAECARLESGWSIGSQLVRETLGSCLDWSSSAAFKFDPIHHYQSVVGYIDSSLNYPFM